MALSMTGYGRSKEILHGRDISVEIKSVNSRYFEFSSRLPRSYGFLEDALKKAVSAEVSRGKTEVSLFVQNLEQGETAVVANLTVAKGYLQAMREMSTELEIPFDATTSVFSRLPDIFMLQRCETDEEELRQDVLQVAAEALLHFNQMRLAEGEKLKADILSRLNTIEQILQTVETESAGRVARYTERLFERLKTVLEDQTIEEARLLTEAAIFADKTAVDEETVRLHSHLKQYREILSGPGAVGRKLDFLTQELNREVNTIGSKCQELEITRMVVDMKAEIEKIREQIQNIE